MTLRLRFRIYLATLHLLALAAAVVYYQDLELWFFLIELLLLVSLYLGLRLINLTLKPLEFVQSFNDLLREQEFSSRFSQVGQLEMDQLIATYNRMLRDLYEERLRLGDQRGFLERFMQVTPVGVLILDFDRRISLANPAAADFLELAPDGLPGRRFPELDSELAVHIAALQPGHSELVKWQGARRLRLEKQTFTDRGFEREFVLVEELTAVLDESERAAYEKLIRLMSHEVNNTIASTNSLLQSCRTYAPQIDLSDRDDYLNALSVVITRNEHLNRFMSDFAQVVKLPDPHLRPCELPDLLEDLETMFRAQCSERAIEWVRGWNQQLPPVRLDREQMEQALINIIKNAIEAIGHRGVLEIRARREPDQVLLEILDDGCGLDATTRAEIFTPFFTSKASGQGLGLTLVKEILLRHHFEFGLNQSDGGRTCFSIRIKNQ